MTSETGELSAASRKALAGFHGGMMVEQIFVAIP